MKRARNGARKVSIPVDENLPVRQKKREILSAIASNDVLILVGETGSGKTTQIPQLILDEAPSSSIVVTQPRRVAAITVATRVADERGTNLGEQVGYAVRFENCISSSTHIRYVTDGVLLREALSDGPAKLRKRYSHIIIDEVHERTVNTDLIIGVMKETLMMKDTSEKPAGSSILTAIRSKLPFKIILMSATTDKEKLVNFFKKKTNLSVSEIDIPGRLHPVRTMNAVEPVTDYIEGAVQGALQVHEDQPFPGDILVFLPGQDDIMSAISLLKERIKRSEKFNPSPFLKAFPLYASMSPTDQIQAIEPLQENGRKVIFATNIAETSITIPSIRFVVDTGLVKVRGILSENGAFADVLRIQPISEAQAEQRKGRAGRTAPGTLYRLYTEEEYAKFQKFPKPEVLRTEASASLLQIICLRHTSNKHQQKNKDNETTEDSANFLSFPLLDKIPRAAMEKGLETLTVLGAVDKSMNLTSAGTLMSRIPTSPMLARCLLESQRLGCVEPVLSLVAILSVEGTVFLTPYLKRDQAKAAHRRFLSSHGDHLTLTNALHAFLQTKESNRVEFCRDHFLQYRSLASAESIRAQLDLIMRHGDITSWAIENPLSESVLSATKNASIDELVGRCLIAGFFRNSARRRTEDGKYLLVGTGQGGQTIDTPVDIHPSSALRAFRVRKNPPLVIYNEYIVTTKPYLRTVMSVKLDWLIEHSNKFFARKGGL